MNRHPMYSLSKILLSWSALALGITALVLSYFLYQALTAQFNSTWAGKLEAELNGLRLSLQHQLSDGEWALADQTLSRMAVRPHISHLVLVVDGKVRLSTRRADLGEPLPADLQAAGLEPALPDFQYQQQKGHFYGLLPLQFRSGKELRGQTNGWLYAHYDTTTQRYETLIDTLEKVALVLAMLALYTLGLQRIVKHQVLLPLQRLVGFTRALTEGQLGSRVQAGHSQEFAHLERAFNQLSAHLQQSMQQIEYQANFDSLTNLANRRFAMLHLEKKIAHARRHQHYGAVLFIDLDHFKNINDSLGHPVGDQLLIEVAKRLRVTVRNEDLTARLGGDEFLVLLDQEDNSPEMAASHASDCAQRVLDAIRQPFEIDVHCFHLSASIGIAIFPSGEDTVADLVRQSDTAMYHAKALGRSAYSLFTDNMQQRTQDKLNLFNDLHQAIEEEAFYLVFQPQLNSRGEASGAEVLCRWNNNGVPVAPDVFIAAAEETNLIIPLGRWILRQSCRHLQHWRQQGCLPASFRQLAVNISPIQFRDPQFESLISELLEEYSLEPQWLELEITENTFLGNNEDARGKIERLSQLGIRFALDDFGTGYSSLSYLQQLPLHKLKIDRSFITDIDKTDQSVPIIESIIQLGNNLNLNVIAEGVETEQQRDYLLAHQCHEFQGYWFSKPLNDEAFCRYLAELQSCP
ncbi:EAL domain-containing protein [Oceanospirillaceae bacterium ASx5O]|nr:EAL domain-containing protein [Oceanospirillaceae bacterium ASx5O]